MTLTLAIQQSRSERFQAWIGVIYQTFIDECKMVSSGDFVHLHVHSEFSLCDGIIRIEELISRVKEWGQSAVALTDHANLFAAIDFYAAAKSAGLKAIIGCELYVRDDLSEDVSKLVVLARDLRGYNNLIKLVSAGYLRANASDSFPVVLREDLFSYGEGCCFISSYHGGLWSKLVLAGKREKLEELRLVFLPFIERGDFYVELCSNFGGADAEQIALVAESAESFNVPLVVSSNAHYLRPEDKDAHLVALAIKNDLKVNELRDMRKNYTAHLQSHEEIIEAFARWPKAIENTIKIAEKCALKLDFGGYHLPKIELGTDETPSQAMSRLALEGLKKRILTANPALQRAEDFKTEKFSWADYSARLDYELSVIDNMGFADYFLIVQDFINWAKSQKIPVGPGRGSGAGSIVAYALRITDLDPLPYNLLFERFLNPERVSMPDFDVDFCQERRDEVIRYVVNRYGENRVAQITTFGKMQAKAVVRDVGRAMSLSYGRVDKIAKLIPDEIGITLDDAIQQEPRLVQEANNDSLIADLLRVARKLEGLSRHTSVHAAGIIISAGPMDEYVPVYRDASGGMITQFEMKSAEKVGLIKFDFLGLKTLTVIDLALKIVKQTTGNEIDINTIPMNDSSVYKMVSEAKSIGVFQLEGGGMQRLLVKLKPSVFEDMIALVALFRPGPLGSGMVDDFVERKHGRQKIDYLLPQLEPVLRDTYGIILYQEQVQKIAAVLANYSLGEADLLRRAMGKKKPEEMAKQKSRFVEGCAVNNIAQEVAVSIFDLMAKFAEYGFNKSHSAAYGLVSYQTAFIKAHYTAEFLAASMTCDMDNTDKVVRYIRDARQFGIEVLRPCINSSNLDFTVPLAKKIRFGLAAIKGVGRAVLEPIVEARAKGGEFVSLTDLARRVDLTKVGKKTLELLIQAGALDCMKLPRSVLLAAAETVFDFSQTVHVESQSGQLSLFDDQVDDDAVDINRLAPIMDSAVGWLIREKKLLGTFVSAHPLDLYKEDEKRFTNASMQDLEKLGGQSDIWVLGWYVDSFERTTREGKKINMIRVETQDSEQVIANFLDPTKTPSSESAVIMKFKVLRAFENNPARSRLEDMQTIESFRASKLKNLQLELSLKPDVEPSAASVADQLREEVLELKNHLQKRQGASGLGVHLRLAKAKIQLTDPKMRVNPNDELFTWLNDWQERCKTTNLKVEWKI